MSPTTPETSGNQHRFQPPLELLTVQSQLHVRLIFIVDRQEMEITEILQDGNGIYLQ